MTSALRKRVLREWRPYTVEVPPSAPAVGRLIPGVVRGLGLEQRLHESQIFQRWAEIVGEFNASICTPVQLKHGRLLVAVTHPAHLQGLRPHKALMLREVQQRVGAHCVRDILLRVG